MKSPRTTTTAKIGAAKIGAAKIGAATLGIIALGSALLFASGPAFAEDAFASRDVNVRSGPGLNFEIVDQLVSGEPVDKGTCNDDGSWCYVRHEGTNGWVVAVFLTATNPNAEPEQPQTPPAAETGTPSDAFQATTEVNVRSGPGTQFAALDRLEVKERVTRGECNADGSWCYITHDGPDGWVAATYLRPLVTTITPLPTRPVSGPQNGAENGTPTAYIATTSVNVRNGPDTQFRAVDQLQAGERVTRGECNEDGSWCYVTHEGNDGWVAAAYLRPEISRPQPPQAITGTAISGMAVRAAPTLFTATTGRIERNETARVDRCTQDGTWCYILANDLEGWVPSAFLRLSGPMPGPGAESNQVLVKARVVMRQGPGSHYASIGTVPSTSAVTVERCNTDGSWCKIDYADQSGWVPAGYLAAPEQTTPAPTGPEAPNAICFTGFGGIRICLGG